MNPKHSLATDKLQRRLTRQSKTCEKVEKIARAFDDLLADLRELAPATRPEWLKGRSQELPSLIVLVELARGMFDSLGLVSTSEREFLQEILAIRTKELVA